MQRRQFIVGSSALLTASVINRTFGDAFSTVFPEVETANGRLRGTRYGGISVFRGIHYGADTGGANRFRPPQPVKKWKGVRDAIAYGNITPQIPSNRAHVYSDLILNDVQPGGMGEDCLVLNLHTPDAKQDGKRPVIVRFHGGGFYGGSSNTPGSDGWMLSRFGDCVVVNVNHRLSSLGFLYLGEDEDFADSGAAGMQDLVAALAWVKENVSMFGGDPNRVLIFGQSGGGAKVSHLLAMPSATGLYHSAGVMSGSRLTAVTREEAAEVSDKFLKQLGLTRKDIKKLQNLHFTTLLKAQADIESEERSSGEAPRSFSPTLGQAIPRHPFSPDAPPMSKPIPIIVSSALDERTYRLRDFDMSWDDVRNDLEKRVGNDADKLLAMYREEDPGTTPFIIHARIDTDDTFRRGFHIMSDLKAEQHAEGGAPIWKYLWTYPSPAFNGRYGAVHGIDVPFSMYDIRAPLVGPTDKHLQLAKQLASAWVSLAATGNPNNSQTPEWPNYDTNKRSTLIFGDTTEAVEDPRKRFREYWSEQSGGRRLI
jgi:para-nitrobenzyl esterase